MEAGTQDNSLGSSEAEFETLGPVMSHKMRLACLGRGDPHGPSEAEGRQLTKSMVHSSSSY